MATTKFKGPVHSVAGYYFQPASYTSARPMTITCTNIVSAEAASNAGKSATILNAQAGGLSKITCAWGNVRQRIKGTLIFVCGRPLNAGNSCVINLIGNTGTGQKFGGRACTIDVFMLGYNS